MLKNSGQIVKRAESNNIKSFGVYKDIKSNVPKNEFHYTGAPKAKSNPQGDHTTYNNIPKNIGLNTVLNTFNLENQKTKEIENIIQKANLESKEASIVIAKKSYLISHKTYKKALEHECFYDVITENDDAVTIIFLPISTSDSKVLCGTQKFDKIHLIKNGLKDFYITRILFQKTMTKKDFIRGELKSKNWYQDFKFRKIIFEKIQKDLDKNNYSILKDFDIMQPNIEFFTKELPLIKFKFTNFEV